MLDSFNLWNWVRAEPMVSPPEAWVNRYGPVSPPWGIWASVGAGNVTAVGLTELSNWLPCGVLPEMSIDSVAIVPSSLTSTSQPSTLQPR